MQRLISSIFWTKHHFFTGFGVTLGVVIGQYMNYGSIELQYMQKTLSISLGIPIFIMICHLFFVKKIDKHPNLNPIITQLKILFLLGSGLIFCFGLYRYSTSDPFDLHDVLIFAASVYYILFFWGITRLVFLRKT